MDHIALTHDLAALAQVVLIDVTLAGDNAVVVGMAVAGLPPRRKRPAIVLGIAGATAMRIALGAVALQLLAIIGLLLAGGLLLLWVCWRMYRELRGPRRHAMDSQHKTLGQAMLQIILADLSMSSVWVLATGLLLSVVLMGVAANLLSHVLERHRWIAWLGLLVVLYVAASMIWEGSTEVARAVGAG
jgi:YjbE family integral membrane protein